MDAIITVKIDKDKSVVGAFINYNQIHFFFYQIKYVVTLRHTQNQLLTMMILIRFIL
jgi:hypothetical protein